MCSGVAGSGDARSVLIKVTGAIRAGQIMAASDLVGSRPGSSIVITRQSLSN
jgi:hypothetical protein